MDFSSIDGLLCSEAIGSDSSCSRKASSEKCVRYPETGRLTARSFSTADPWYIDYEWFATGDLSRLEVVGNNIAMWITHFPSGALKTSNLELDATEFERMKRSDAFTPGFPQRPCALEGVQLDESLNVWGDLCLEKRLESLGGNPELAGVRRLSVTPPDESAFFFLERVVLSCSLDELSLSGSGERCARFENWFRCRHGTSLPISW